MKQLFLLICFIGTLSVSGQESPASSAGDEIEVRLHPNPVYDGVVTIETNRTGPRTIRIFDLFGKVVLEERLTSDKLRLYSLVPGVYMVQLQQEGQLATKKLVIR
jgi:hypothetical protein